MRTLNDNVLDEVSQRSGNGMEMRGHSVANRELRTAHGRGLVVVVDKPCPWTVGGLSVAMDVASNT